jgi:predicted NACHT family NTPase
MTEYIQPNLEKYDSFEKFLERNPYIPPESIGSNFSFGDFFKIKRLFVVAEPGYGKTRLLKEIIVEAFNKKKQGIFIDLKKVDRDLKIFISKPNRIFESITPERSGEELKAMTLLKTEGFALENSEETIICLDALDEVIQQYFSNVVAWIKDFSRQFNNTHILISCRTHHLKKYSRLFSDMDFKYIHIDSFSNDQVKTYLEKSGLGEEQIKRIIEISESGNRQLPLDIPRYLETVVDFIEKKGIDNLKNLSRGDMLESFIYKKLEIEDEKNNQKTRDLTKRVLEKLALLMEMYQANTLTKDELMTFFDDVKSDLKNNFLQQVPLKEFYDRSLLKDNIDTIEFENTGFQEYPSIFLC